MSERVARIADTVPEFANDYVNHTPSEFSVTRLEDEAGNSQYAFSFIDHRFVPAVEITASGAQGHTAKVERRFRSTVVVDEALWLKMVGVVASLQPSSSEKNANI